MTSLSTIASPAPQTGSRLPYNDTASANAPSSAGDGAAVQFQAYEAEAHARSGMPASLGSPAEKAIPTDMVASGRVPAPATPAPTGKKAQQRMKREPVAGVPRQMDLGPMLFHTFLLSPMNKFERADVVKRALMEWNTTGPSERVRQRLESLMLHPDAARNVAGNWIAQIPAAAWNPSQRGTDLIDALMLHLMDTGVHGELVRGYIQALKSAGLYDSVVAGLQSDHPGKTKEWGRGNGGEDSVDMGWTASRRCEPGRLYTRHALYGYAAKSGVLRGTAQSESSAPILREEELGLQRSVVQG